MRRREPCRALLLDLDGVLRRFDPARRVAAEPGVSADLVSGAAFEPDRLRPVVLGQVSHAQWMAGVVDAVTASTDDRPSAERAVGAWFAYRGEVVPEVLAVVRQLRSAGLPVVLATNATDVLDADLAALDLRREVDDVLNSSVLGHAKPSAEFFAAGCELLGAPARSVLFVDDSERNVRGSRAAGLAAVRYTGPADLSYVTAMLAP